MFEYENSELADVVVSGMNKLDIAGCKLSVQRIPQSSAALLLKPSPSVATIDPLIPVKSCVLQLSNMVSQADLDDNDLYQELLEDVTDECNRHGKVDHVVIPRGGNANEGEPFVGKVFVCFVDVEGAEKALKAVNGRRFNGTTVEAVFFGEADFQLLVRKFNVVQNFYCGDAVSLNRANKAPSIVPIIQRLKTPI